MFDNIFGIHEQSAAVARAETRSAGEPTSPTRHAELQGARHRTSAGRLHSDGGLVALQRDAEAAHISERWPSGGG